MSPIDLEKRPETTTDMVARLIKERDEGWAAIAQFLHDEVDRNGSSIWDASVQLRETWNEYQASSTLTGEDILSAMLNEPVPTETEVLGALRHHPQLLWDVAQALHGQPPKIASAWKPVSEFGGGPHRTVTDGNSLVVVQFADGGFAQCLCPLAEIKDGKRHHFFETVSLAGSPFGTGFDTKRLAMDAADEWLRGQGWVLLP